MGGVRVMGEAMERERENTGKGVMIIALHPDLIEVNAVDAGDLASDAQIQKGEVGLLAHCIERLGLERPRRGSGGGVILEATTIQRGFWRETHFAMRTNAMLREPQPSKPQSRHVVVSWHRGGPQTITWTVDMTQVLVSTGRTDQWVGSAHLRPGGCSLPARPRRSRAQWRGAVCH